MHTQILSLGLWMCCRSCLNLRGLSRLKRYSGEETLWEVHDQAGAQPEIMARLVQYWETCYTETGMFDPSRAFPHVQQ
jgi:hypothetical protein